MSDVLDGFAQKARDHARVPMQWDASPNAGFTTGKPWMRVNEDYESWNASSQLQDSTSVLVFYKQALAVRKAHPVLTYGEFMDLSNNHPQVFGYLRTLGDTQALVLLNFKETEATFEVLGIGELNGYQLVLANYHDMDGKGNVGREVVLRGYEGRIYLKG